MEYRSFTIVVVGSFFHFLRKSYTSTVGSLAGRNFCIKGVSHVSWVIGDLSLCQEP